MGTEHHTQPVDSDKAPNQVLLNNPLIFTWQQEQEYADQQSTAVNKAYDALLKPVPRALYLLKLNGLSLEEKDIQLDGEFLMDIMEINEEIAGMFGFQNVSGS